MWPSTSEKNIHPILVCWFLFHFSTNNVCKNAVFFLVASVPKKAFVFPNNRISEAHICHQGWFKKISWKWKTKQQKKLRGNVFPLRAKFTCKNWARLDEEKKFGLRSHLHGFCRRPVNSLHHLCGQDMQALPQIFSLFSIPLKNIY